MPRPYHSPSSIKLAMRCRSAWAREYLLNLRAPRVTWEQIKNKPNHPQRGPALGVAVHSVFEAWHSGESPNWNDLPGQVALSGAHLIPHPSRCVVWHTEGPIGRELLPPDAARPAHAPDRILRVGGIPWGGFRDLLANAPEEWRRLNVAANDGWGLVDYKSTGSIEKWALPGEVRKKGKLVGGLALDLQANVYTIDVCELLDLSWLPGRWLYLETTAARRHAEPRDVRLELSRAHDVVAEANILARELDTLHDAYHAGHLEIEHVPKNAGACNDYRGCHHHVSRGGTCNTKPPPIMRLKRNAKGDELMALNPKLVQQQQEAAAAMNAAAPPPAEGTASEAPPENTSAEGVPAAPAQAPVQTAAKPRAQAKAATPKAATAKGPAPLDFASPFTLAFEGGQLSADVLTLTKVVPAIGAARYELSQGDFAVEVEAVSLALLLAALPAA